MTARSPVLGHFGDSLCSAISRSFRVDTSLLGTTQRSMSGADFVAFSAEHVSTELMVEGQWSYIVAPWLLLQQLCHLLHGQRQVATQKEPIPLFVQHFLLGHLTHWLVEFYRHSSERCQSDHHTQTMGHYNAAQLFPHTHADSFCNTQHIGSSGTLRVNEHETICLATFTLLCLDQELTLHIGRTQ